MSMRQYSSSLSLSLSWFMFMSLVKSINATFCSTLLIPCWQRGVKHNTCCNVERNKYASNRKHDRGHCASAHYDLKPPTCPTVGVITGFCNFCTWSDTPSRTSKAIPPGRKHLRLADPATALVWSKALAVSLDDIPRSGCGAVRLSFQSVSFFFNHSRGFRLVLDSQAVTSCYNMLQLRSELVWRCLKVISLCHATGGRWCPWLWSQERTARSQRSLDWKSCFVVDKYLVAEILHPDMYIISCKQWDKLIRQENYLSTFAELLPLTVKYSCHPAPRAVRGGTAIPRGVWDQRMLSHTYVQSVVGWRSISPAR